MLLRIPQVVRVLDHAALDLGETETFCLLVLKKRDERNIERDQSLNFDHSSASRMKFSVRSTDDAFVHLSSQQDCKPVSCFMQSSMAVLNAA